jgi:6-phosphogluconolactonase
MPLEIEVLRDADAVAERGAQIVASAAAVSIAARDRFTFAVSGGRTPWAMFASLYGRMPWEKVTIFQVDERIAPDGDPDRNLTQLQGSLPPGGAADVRPMPVWAEDLEGAAALYADALPDQLDLVHLGLGPDGHTASLFPGSPALEERERLVVPNPEDATHPHDRLTFTFPAIAEAELAVFTVAGADKREAFGRVRAGDDVPAAHVTAQRVIWLVDAPAMGS